MFIEILKKTQHNIDYRMSIFFEYLHICFKKISINSISTSIEMVQDTIYLDLSIWDSRYIAELEIIFNPMRRSLPATKGCYSGV